MNQTSPASPSSDAGKVLATCRLRERENDLAYAPRALAHMRYAKSDAGYLLLQSFDTGNQLEVNDGKITISSAS